MMWLKLWLRDALAIAVWSVRPLLRRAPRRAGVRILVYHTLAELPPRQDRGRMSVPPALFAAQLRWLQQQAYSVVGLDEAFEMIQGLRPIPPKAVAITFDDGFADTFSRAYPLLKDAGWPAAAFVVSGSVGQSGTFPWLGTRTKFGRPMTWEELEALSGDRRITIGSHGWSHRKLSALPAHEQQEEIERSQHTLVERLGHPVTWFAYPYGQHGSFSDETVACLKTLGFRAACANVMGLNYAGDSPWTLRRTRIGWEDRLWRFRLKMDGAYDWIDAWRSSWRRT